MASKGAARRKTKSQQDGPQDPIVIDESKGLIFADEEHLFKHFESDIKGLEKTFFAKRTEEDFALEDFQNYEDYLGAVLEDPAQIVEDKRLIPENTSYVYVAEYNTKAVGLFYYVAVTYVTGDTPSFVYLHFPTKDKQLVQFFSKGEVVYDRALKEVLKGAVEGDALSEGDELAIGLYIAMAKLRSDKDIKEEEFKDYVHLREETIDAPDEIWRSNDYSGNVLVTFVREYDNIGDGKDIVYYIVVTVEDEPTNSHALLFSFPTSDPTLAERYRRGENLQAEEVVQEPSH